MAYKRQTPARRLANQTEDTYGGVSEMGARLGRVWPVPVDRVICERVVSRCRLLEADLAFLRTNLELVLELEAA